MSQQAEQAVGQGVGIDTSAVSEENVVAALSAQTITCGNCEREVANGSIYCPHCCGDDGREGAIKRGGFVGGVIGLMAGAVIAAFWFSFVGPERGTWGMVFGITMTGVVSGLMLGMIRQRKG